MMSSESLQTLTDASLRNKMPLFEGTIASAGLPKPQNMPGFLGKQTLQYNGAYFTYDPRGKDGAGFSPPWSGSKTSLLDGRSPVSHLYNMEGQSHIIYRKDSSSSEEGHSHASSLRHAPVQQGFMLYTKSPEVSSPTAATSVALRKQKTGGENLPSPSENSVYLAIPKPVYGHNPCCNELGCMIGRRYSVEHGSPRIPNTVYEHDWTQTDARYTERPQRKAQDTVLQQRGLQLESSPEPLKRMTVEAYSPGRARPVIEPNFSSYPCTPTRSLFGSLSEHSTPPQTSPRGYPGLYPSHPTYEHMTSEVYQDRSLMSKYGQLAQHPVFYYPQANGEVESRTQCKDSGSKQREDGPVVHKHIISNPREQYIVPQPLHAEIPLPLPSPEMLPGHPFMQGFDYPCYAVPRLHFKANQIGAPLKRQHASPTFHPSRINVSPSSQHVDHPMPSAASLHKDKLNTSRHVDQLHGSSAFLRVDQTSPARHVSQTSPSSIQIGRFFPHFTSLHIDPAPVLPPAGLSMDRVLDYSSREAQRTCSKPPKSVPVSSATWPPQSPNHSSDRVRTDGPNSANVRKIIHYPAGATGSKHNDSVSGSETSPHKRCLKRSISHSSQHIKIKEEDEDLYKVEFTKKLQKVEKENIRVGNQMDSPPMPVIDSVFSLAPYQAYLQASGVLFPGRLPQRVIESEQREVKPKIDIKEKRPERDQQQSVVRLSSKEVCPETPREKTAVEDFKTKKIKVEKVDPSDMNRSVQDHVGQNDCRKVTIKKEPEDSGLSDTGPTLLKQKCEPDELERKPSSTDENETSDERKPAQLTAQMTPQGDTRALHKHNNVLQPKSSPPLQASESKIGFKNIPPHCLKLSTYKIIIPDGKQNSPAPPPEMPPAPPPTELIKLKLQMPVRKHFFELHHSLCKLISKSVLASLEQELKDWLSRLEVTEPAAPSSKGQKVSCLFGVKAREVWLNEEMKSALHKVLERLREYTMQERCPFPHVMRTGAVFLPMLVVKELLFPMVQGSFIDQVLQEHRVELRPTTLSEEKILIQLHKRACSSRLRRLMSLKHLPDIYADAVNLLYYTCVCKQLGLDVDLDCRDGGSEASNSMRAPEFPDIAASPPSPSESPPQRCMKSQETPPQWSRNRTKHRVKSSSRRTFLDNSLSDAEDAGDVEKIVVGDDLDTFRKEDWGDHEPQTIEGSGTDHTVAEGDSSLVQQSTASENSWTCPLTLDQLCPSPSDTEESSAPWPVSQSSGPSTAQVRSKNRSGMILKLRRMLSEGIKRKRARYQAVSESHADDVEGASGERDLRRRTRRWQRTGGFSHHALRPLGSSSKRKTRSLLKIKYCPYLSACHSAEHRRRWVLRSAVQTARRAMRFYYPDLVGKRIRHLYEEDDKSEVWYRGEVLRIHEAHTDPLKTIFEVRYDSEPEWKYYLELMIDYKKGWLKIED